MKPQVAMKALIAGDVAYTTALGATVRAAFRNVLLRVVMTICSPSWPGEESRRSKT